MLFQGHKSVMLSVDHAETGVLFQGHEPVMC